MEKDIFKNFIIALAPMAGVTDFAFRKICADFGADMVVTEMISAKAFEHDSKKTSNLLYEMEHSAIKSVQIFGHDEESIKNIVLSKEIEPFDIIDLNCGCPAPKIVGNKDGSFMMSSIENTKKIIQTIRANTNKLVSVKFRLGINGINNYIEFGKMCEECGVDFVCLHARTREQQYGGEVDKSAYKKLVDAINIPVIWSGDILTKEDVDYAKKIGCKGVMIGRGALGNPNIFAELKNKPIPYTKKEAAKLHFDLIRTKFKNDTVCFNYFKKHLAWYCKFLTNATDLKRQAVSVQNVEDVYNFIEKLPNDLN
ncbi:MAG: tRNA-dihydrouridine synthase family protein [Clostridia bacterium]|nr:tRNA-dihydrouridine synthase family protein [Clostridia bacterium]